jgi:hypothetical protein
MEFVMTRLFVFVATASLLSVSAQTGLTESPDPIPGTSEAVRVQVNAGTIYEPRDLASSGLAAGDMVEVTSLGWSGVGDSPSSNER